MFRDPERRLLLGRCSLSLSDLVGDFDGDFVGDLEEDFLVDEGRGDDLLFSFDSRSDFFFCEDLVKIPERTMT